MKTVLFILLFSTTTLQAQVLPRFENDTLYTTSGFKIYKGQTIIFAEGTGNDGRFRYLKIRGSDHPRKLTHQSLVVDRVWDFYVSGLDNAYIKIRGTVFRDGKSRSLRFKMIFEKAIQGFDGSSPEVVVPDEFKRMADELARWYKLYQDGGITKDEFEIQKKRLINETISHAIN